MVYAQSEVVDGLLLELGLGLIRYRLRRWTFGPLARPVYIRRVQYLFLKNNRTILRIRLQHLPPGRLLQVFPIILRHKIRESIWVYD